MWELDYKENWAPKNWCFWTVVLEKTLESPLDSKVIPPVHPKGDQSWVFIGRTNIEAETPILWPPDAKSWLIWKDPDVGKDWGQEKKRTTRGWDGWMASPTQWTWVWVSSGSWWWTGSPGVLWFMGSQRVGHDWVTELNWIWEVVPVSRSQLASGTMSPFGCCPREYYSNFTDWHSGLFRLEFQPIYNTLTMFKPRWLIVLSLSSLSLICCDLL